eukprot:TRINITY_DN11874_c0_g1_i1.p1 TRINITY_DN11874_c0_g1~~TRINITY_DN11874_c0_g1_i1.p1  ORF type:complete len:272 (-),score=45.47 TRINITY_DN11874_c0_g1_i1:17-781(-)
MRVSGTIPSEFGSMTRLEWLYLKSLSLSGTFPTELGRLTKLLWVDASDNQISGTIPSELFSDRVIEWVEIYSNSLSGTLPDFNNVTQLMWLDTSNNYLTGSIPLTVTTLPKLNWLDLSFNNISGGIPPDFFKLTELDGLILSNNRLTEFPLTQLLQNGTIERINKLDVSHNQIEVIEGAQTSTAKCSRLSPRLTIDLSSNKIRTFPARTLNLLCSNNEAPPYGIINLSSNRMSGTIKKKTVSYTHLTLPTICSV